MGEEELVVFIYKQKSECKEKKLTAKEFAQRVINGVLSTNDLFNSLIRLGFKDVSIYKSLEELYNE